MMRKVDLERVIEGNEQGWEVVRYFRNRYFFEPQKIDDPYTFTFTHPDHYHFLLYVSEKIVGYAHVQLWPEKRAIIRIMVIEESWRKYGLGKRLVQSIERWLFEHNYFTLCAESRAEVVGFYKKCGFNISAFTDPEGYESDPADIQMQKQLLP
jgi:GNAT superfamily N-acetyltransferase